MKKELDLLLQMAEKAFMVELLKMPTAIRKMKRKDLLNLQEGEEVALAAAAVCIFNFITAYRPETSLSAVKISDK